MSIDKFLKDLQEKNDFVAPAGHCIACKGQVINPDGEFNSTLVYSEAGKKEFRISQCCERCFDDLFKEE